MFRNKAEEIVARRILSFYNQEIPIQKGEVEQQLEETVLARLSSGKKIYQNEHESYNDFSKSEMVEALDICKSQGYNQEDYFRNKINDLKKSEASDSLSKAFDNLFIKSEVVEETPTEGTTTDEVVKSEEVVEDDLEKGGEGSKGGKVIGHTKSGKPVYEKLHPSYKKFTAEDHKDAIVEHKIHGNEFGEDYHRDQYKKTSK
jgi:hypothetical protein